MNVTLLNEPDLQFQRGTHVDIRAGLAQFSPFDLEARTVPDPIGVGLVGTAATVDGVRDWIESCQNGVQSGEERARELRPDFPGMKPEVFGTQLRLSDHTTRSISKYELQAALTSPRPMEAVVELFLNHSRDLAAKGGLHVVVVAPPVEVFLLGAPPARDPEEAIDDSQDSETAYSINFHDLFKARALELPVPTQVLRPDTYGGGSTKKDSRRTHTLQDKATRAWNFHVALYYKAGGVPWRLVKQPSALSTCYVGASFYKSVEGDRLLTSVAQVFDERGEGLIVQGGSARVDKDDRTSHLSANDAFTLLSSGLAAYRREHKNMPARLVLHKTSYFDDEELDGFRRAANAEKVEFLDLVSVRRSSVRLFRTGTPPVLRGTTMQFDERSGIVYLRGTVPYFKMYPGMYVPRALEFAIEEGETRPLELAKELLSLSKLNFNNTQFDGGDPITIRAARRVGDILKHVVAMPGFAVQSRFRYFT